MANQKVKTKKDNAVVAYFRATRAELRKVRWPTMQQGWLMTRVVLVVTVLMAIFLGVLDFLFQGLLGEVVGGNVWLMVVGVVVIILLLLAATWIGKENEA